MNDRNDQPTTQLTPEAKPTAYELAKRIATHMPGARWMATRRISPNGEELPQSADLVRDLDGAAVSLRVRGYRNEGRVTFRPSWPNAQTAGLAHAPPSRGPDLEAVPRPGPPLSVIEKRIPR